MLQDFANGIDQHPFGLIGVPDFMSLLLCNHRQVNLVD
jgi:hypothetical protein